MEEAQTSVCCHQDLLVSQDVNKMISDAVDKADGVKDGVKDDSNDGYDDRDDGGIREARETVKAMSER